jgi:hypothetical protein
LAKHFADTLLEELSLFLETEKLCSCRGLFVIKTLFLSKNRLKVAGAKASNVTLVPLANTFRTLGGVFL